VGGVASPFEDGDPELDKKNNSDCDNLLDNSVCEPTDGIGDNVDRNSPEHLFKKSFISKSGILARGDSSKGALGSLSLSSSTFSRDSDRAFVLIFFGFLSPQQDANISKKLDIFIFNKLNLKKHFRFKILKLQTNLILYLKKLTRLKNNIKNTK
jgi:hypothetical protein